MISSKLLHLLSPIDNVLFSLFQINTALKSSSTGNVYKSMSMDISSIFVSIYISGYRVNVYKSMLMDMSTMFISLY